MRLGWLIGLLILSFILLISYFLTLYIFLPIFGEKVEDIYLFNKYIIALFIPHYIFIFIFIIKIKTKIKIKIEENKLDWFFVGYIFFYITYNLILANLFYDLLYGQKYIPAASLSMLTIISFVGLGAGIYFGISFDEFVKNIKNEIKYKEKKEETEKEEKLSERTLLVINKNSKMIVKSFKGFPDDVLDDLIDGIANWFKLRNVKGVQKFMVFSTEDYGFAAEYVEGKNLREYITMKGGKLSPEKAACICLKIAMILKDCLEHEIIHRDLKPENIIITNNEEIMIVDWEFSTKLGIKPKTFMGTLLYAPKDEIVTDRYDVYSLGKILFLMITGRIEETRTVSIENKEIKALIEKMLSNDPMKRPSMDDIINSLNKICQKQPK